MAHLFIQNSGSYYITGALSLFGLSNFFLLSEAGGYWGPSASMNPFTQTWSLGVEEQFYILFPLLIYCSGFGKNSNNGSRNLLVVVGVLSVVSLAIFISLYATNHSAAYYLMPSRFWEIAVGCLTFIGFAKRSSIVEMLGKAPPLLIVCSLILAMYLPQESAVISTVIVVLLTSILCCILTLIV